jgi:hypothetical protein
MGDELKGGAVEGLWHQFGVLGRFTSWRLCVCEGAPTSVALSTRPTQAPNLRLSSSRVEDLPHKNCRR